MSFHSPQNPSARREAPQRERAGPSFLEAADFSSEGSLVALGAAAHITTVEIKEGESYWVFLKPEVSEKEALRAHWEFSYLIRKAIVFIPTRLITRSPGKHWKRRLALTGQVLLLHLLKLKLRLQILQLITSVQLSMDMPLKHLMMLLNI